MRFVAILASVIIARSLVAHDVLPADTIRGTSKNFSVQSYRSGPDPQKVLMLCERLRTELQRVWGEQVDAEKWEPRCDVIVHPSRDNYQNATGPGGGQTLGSSVIELVGGNITCRRIDLLIDDQGELKALPHELTHVVVADYFGVKQPPPWLDEGIAILADTREKQLLHERDCREAIAAGTALSLDELLQLQQLTSPEQFAAFYGQSATLVQMLVEQQRPATLIKFALESTETSFEIALSRHYNIDNTRELEKRWKTNLRSAAATRQRTPIAIVRFQP